MGTGDEPALSVDEFVEYCRTQSRLLSGSIERMGDEADALLDDVDAEIAELRARLDGEADVEGTERPQSADGPGESPVDLESIADAESALATRQAEVEAKQARMRAYRELATGYTELAAELASDVADGREAMERVVRFEADRDAPAYFDDRTTVYEAAASSSETEG